MAEPDAKPNAKALKTAREVLPDRRTRQVRTFPVAIPDRSIFSFLFDGVLPPEHRGPLEALCARVSRLGHSSSLVRCAVGTRHVAPTLVPDPEGNVVLRVYGPGQVDRLESSHRRHQGVESRLLPARPERYGAPGRQGGRGEVGMSVFSEDWIVFERRGGARPLSSRGADLAVALRRSLIEAHGAETLPPALSGHEADGTPAEQAHVAFVALPFVGHDHADGSIQGCAIVLPSAISAADRALLERIVARWESTRARDGGLLELASASLPPVLVARVDLSEKSSLSPSTWTRPARRFVTATPIALDRNPGNLWSNGAGTAAKAVERAAGIISEACVRIGLPAPTAVEISRDPLLPGAQPVRAFQPWPSRPGRPQRARVHAMLEFSEPVRGPVLLGAGRYHGLGLCLPIGEGRR